jgi:TetR/AcrR family transcriptional regulator
MATALGHVAGEAHPGRDAILAAATAVFAERGFHGAKMREIAQRAQVSQGLLHHHFGTKEALWDAVGERILRDFLDGQAALLDRERPTAETVAASVRGYLNYCRARPEALRIYLWRLLEGPKGERQARSRTMTRRAVPMFEAAQEAGVIRRDMPPGFVMCVAGALIFQWLQNQQEIRDALAVTGDEPFDDDEFLRYVLRIVAGLPATEDDAKDR